MITTELKVEPRLCVHCGACGEVCLFGAIDLKKDKYGTVTPYIDNELCRRCGLCHKVCPVEAFEYAQHSIDLNSARECWSAYCAEEGVRYRASSAGVVRVLAKYAKDESKVDAVVALSENPENGLAPKFKVFKNIFDLNEFANSKYCPVSFNGVIRDLCEHNELRHILFIGLPCQIRAIKKAFDCIPQLQGRILNSIGIFCKKTKDMRYAQFLAARLKCKRGLYPKFQFRGQGWPGMINIRCDGIEHTHAFNNAATSSFPWEWYLFSPNSCLFCYDPFARQADISVGDPWLAKYLNDPAYAKGASYVIAYTKFGTDLIGGCSSIIKNPVGSEEVFKSQSIKEINNKQLYAPGRLSIVLHKKIDRGGLIQRINARWFLGCKLLFEYFFQFSFFARLNCLIFKILRRWPQEIFNIDQVNKWLK